MADIRPPVAGKDAGREGDAHPRPPAGAPSRPDPLTGKDVAGAGALMLSVNLIGAGIGAALGAAVGALVPLLLVGFGIGFFAGIYVVIKRFSAL